MKGYITFEYDIKGLDGSAGSKQWIYFPSQNKLYCLQKYDLRARPNFRIHSVGDLPDIIKDYIASPKEHRLENMSNRVHETNMSLRKFNALESATLEVSEAQTTLTKKVKVALELFPTPE